MTATHSNPRLFARPCERMRGCSFADDFISAEWCAENKGTDTGTGNVISHGLTVDGNGYIAFDIVSQPGSFSVVVQFNAAALMTTAGILAGNANLIAGTPADGFCVWADADGIKATYSTGVAIATACAVAVDYSDGEIHTVTYVSDQVGGEHLLYVDDLDYDSTAAVIGGPTGATTALNVGGDGTNNSVATILKVRVFDADLSSAEHDFYHSGTVASWFRAPLAAYRCDSFCDDTAGDLVWDRTVNRNDLTKGDGATGATFPTFVDDTDEDAHHYEFDGVDDYLSGLFTLPTAYTVSLCKSEPITETPLPWPTVAQDNDGTALADFLTSGGFYGDLRGLVIHSGVLTTLQEYEAEYQLQYWQRRGRAFGMYNRLITEGVVALSMFLDAEYATFTDYSPEENHGSGVLVTRNGKSGCTFASATSRVEVADDASLRLDELSIVLWGDFASGSGTATLIDKGTNYKVNINAVQHRIYLNSVFATFNATDRSQIAITAKDGQVPRLYVDGQYVAEFLGAVTLDDTDTTGLDIGNANEANAPTSDALKQVLICNVALTDYEINALNDQAKVVNEATETAPSSCVFSTTDTGSLQIVTRGQASTGMWVDWGDGHREWIAHTGTGDNITTTHDYDGLAGTKAIYFYGDLSQVTYFSCVDATFGGDIGSFSDMPSLTYLRFNGTAISGDIGGIDTLTGLTVLWAHVTSVTGDIGQLSTLVSMTNFKANANALTGNIGDLATMVDLDVFYVDGTTVDYNSGTLAAWSGNDIRLQNCAFTQTEVDDFLVDLDTAGGTNGTLNIAGTNAAPSGTGTTAKTSLLGKGWTVTTN